MGCGYGGGNRRRRRIFLFLCFRLSGGNRRSPNSGSLSPKVMGRSYCRL